ncbi:MAG: transposase [Armatimonadota bacterium]|nr:transposase [Armatimonadota bacterium]MDR7403154.1 transposase [Armatimonadota bacterium]
MPRPRRVQLAGGVYHVTAHAVGRDALFRDDTERRSYLRILRDALHRGEATLLAFVLMDTHVHVVLRTSKANVSSTVQWLHGRYGEAVNRRWKRKGHVFGGRFYSTVVDTDSYLLEVTRYVHLNPVRAGVVGRPEEYAWSSYRQYIRGEAGPAEPHLVLAMLGTDRAARVREYRKFVEEPLVARLRDYRPGTRGWEVAALAAVADALGVLRADIVERRIPGLRLAAAGLLVDELGMAPARAARLLRVRVRTVRMNVQKVRAGKLARKAMDRIVRARQALSGDTPTV